MRQWCDATARPCILVEQGVGANPLDTVLLDCSPLRSTDIEQVHRALTMHWIVFKSLGDTGPCRCLTGHGRLQQS